MPRLDTPNRERDDHAAFEGRILACGQDFSPPSSGISLKTFTFFQSDSAGGGIKKGGHVTRSLPDNPNLDHLKHEAKRILRSAKAGDADELALLRRISKYADASDADIQSSIALLEVQQALAKDYGYAGWPELKTYVESRTPVLQPLRPALKVGDYDAAITHYVDWLGFNLDWDWREAPGQPTIASLSRDGVSFFISDAQDTSHGPASIHLSVKNLDALVDEWNVKRPGSVKARIAPPYEFPDVPITDEWGNVFVFEGQNEQEEQKRRDAIRPKMRAYIQAQLDADRGFPTPEEVREVVGPPLGAAIETLNEFQGYGEAYNTRQKEKENEP
ncbi:MAG: glyoxalase superfamily protein [Pseudomonadota bacterium]